MKDDQEIIYFHLSSWDGQKKKCVSHQSFASELLEGDSADDRVYAVNMSLISIFSKKPRRTELLVDQKALLQTLTTLQMQEEYWNRADVAKMRASFESKELIQIRRITGIRNVGHAIKKKIYMHIYGTREDGDQGTWGMNMSLSSVFKYETREWHQEVTEKKISIVWGCVVRLTTRRSLINCILYCLLWYLRRMSLYQTCRMVSYYQCFSTRSLGGFRSFGMSIMCDTDGKWCTVRSMAISYSILSYWLYTNCNIQLEPIKSLGLVVIVGTNKRDH